MAMMTHEGYLATVELDEAAGLFHGDIINTRDVLPFQGHRRVASTAARQHKSLNAFVAETLDRAS